MGLRIGILGTRGIPNQYGGFEQVAEYLQMNPQVVRRWLNEKRLPGIKIGKEWRIAKEDLDKYLEELKNK